MKKLYPTIFKEGIARAASTLALVERGECLRGIEVGYQLISEALKGGHTVFACGNGGSAADAQHFTAELIGHYKAKRKPLAALSLTTDTSALTAIGNDDGYGEVFARQVNGLGKKDDVLVAFTTSGRSHNVLRAITDAHQIGMRTIVLTGTSGDWLRGDEQMRVDACVVVPSEETARIQEVHGLIIHLWCEALDEAFA